MALRAHDKGGLVALRVGVGPLIEAFIVLAVFTILIIRFVLSASGYPQLGGGGLHIAHMLWGGFLMLAGMFLVFATMGWLSLATGALLGGVGFGFFIDEVGKFITSDNDYFFRPAVAVMYVVFVLLFLVLRALERRAISPRGYLANGLTSMREGAIRGFSAHERDRAEMFLSRADPEDPLTAGLRAMLAQIDTATSGETNIVVRFGQACNRGFRRVMTNRWFDWSVVIILIVVALLELLGAVVSLADATEMDFAYFMEVTFTAIGALLIAIGVVRIWWSRLAAFRWFKRGILVNLLITEMFVFYRAQFVALVGLIITLIMWAVLEYMIQQETKRLMEQEEASAGLPGALPEREHRETHA